MAKKKSSMALFEVVTREKRHHKAAMTVPEWMKGTAATEASRQALISPAEEAQPEQEHADPTGLDVPPGAAPGPDVETDYHASDRHEPAATQGEKVLSVADGRVTVSLNYVSCAVAGLGLLLAILAAFLLGRASAPKAPAASKAARTHAKAGLVLGTRPPRRTQRIVGKYYLVIQELGGLTPAMKKDAHEIAVYCEAARGDAATVINDGRQYVVLSGKPFDSPAATEARVYAADIDALGNRYKADVNRKYDFNQMDSQGRLDPWFRKEQ